MVRFGLSDVDGSFDKALKELVRMEKSLTPKFMKAMHRRNLKPIMLRMQSNSKSKRIAEMVGITTAKRSTGDYGAKVGVIKNDVTKFPTFSAQALASIIEYGTEERFKRNKKTKGFLKVSSTGSMPMVPFLRPAWDEGITKFINDTEKSITRKVNGST